MTELRQSAAEWCFHKKVDSRAYYQRLKEIGFYGVEMADPAHWAEARAAGLELVNISGPGMTSGLNDVAQHGSILPAVRAAIRTASDNGIADVIVFSGNHGAIGEEQGIDACIKGLKDLVRDAQAGGVRLLFEVLNSHDHPDYHADHSSYAFRIVREIDSPALRVLYDIYHMHRMGEDVLAVISEHLEWIGHFHIAGSPRRDYPGTAQPIDYPRVVRQIHALGYAGLWGHEFIPGSDPLDELTRVHAEFARYAA